MRVSVRLNSDGLPMDQRLLPDNEYIVIAIFHGSKSSDFSYWVAGKSFKDRYHDGFFYPDLVSSNDVNVIDSEISDDWEIYVSHTDAATYTFIGPNEIRGSKFQEDLIDGKEYAVQQMCRILNELNLLPK
jgi:hypothetical protein